MNKHRPIINKVIGIGASAGGLDAIQDLFDHIPADTGHTFVIIQHLSPDFKSLMPELLAKHTQMPIFTAEDKLKIAPNCIYLNQSTRNLHIKGDTLYLLDKGPKSNLNLPIDIFFHTLGEEFKEKAVGIILSGTGSDGSRGIKSIKEAKGTIFVQDPENAQFDGMPNAAISTGITDYILSTGEIGKAISNQLSKQLSDLLTISEKVSNEELFSKVLMEVQKFSGLNLRQYKNNTLLRRLEKRLNIHDINTLEDYLTFLEHNDKEKKMLYEDFLIGVTSFFRDKEAFSTLEQEVIPNLCNPHEHHNPVRVWVPGCSTGEEAYSLAILIDQYLMQSKIEMDFKIFATDISENSLNKASSGIFHINATEEIETNILKEYFIKTGDHIQIVKKIRDKIVFSVHNILKDPPFIRMDLISCRNLLIYLNNETQRRVLNQFLFSLNRNGYLFLGSSESLGSFENNFLVIHNKHKIFLNISANPNRPDKFSNNFIPSRTFKFKGIQEYPSVPKRDSEIQYYKYISDRYGPSLLFLDKDFNILFIKGNVGEKLSPRDGLFQQNIIQLVEPSLASVIRNGVRRIRSDNKPIIVKDVLIKNQDKTSLTDLTFEKSTLIGNDQELFIIEFSEDRSLEEEKIEIKNVNIGDSAAQRIEDLEYELRIKNEELQNVIEELETANEELQSANEELMASNEELQSTNEELQSVNEELYTVNSELQEKNKELADVNDLINNLINATEIATLFLDKEMKIKKFNNSLIRNLDLEPSDIGRSVSSFNFNFNHSTSQLIINECERCLKTKTPFEKQIKSPDQSNYLLRINPFFNHQGFIDGIVITLVDVSELISTRHELRSMEDKYVNLFKNISVGVIHGEIISDSSGHAKDLKVLSINPKFENDLGFSAPQIEGNLLTNFLTDTDVNSIVQIMDKSVKSGTSYTTRYFSQLMKKDFVVRSFRPKKGEAAAVFEDVTELLKRKETLRKTIKRLNMAIEITGTAIWEWDPVNNIVTDKNEYWDQLYQLNNNKEVTKGFYEKIYEDDKDLVQKDINELLADKTTKYHHIFRYHDEKTKRLIWIENVGHALKRNSSGQIISVLGVSRDITKEKEAYMKLEAENTFNESISQNSTSGIYIYDLKTGNNTYTNKRYSEILGWTVEEVNEMSSEAFFQLFHPDDQAAVSEHMDIILSQRKEDSIKYRFKHKSGHWVTCYSVDSPLEEDADGSLKSFIGSFIDLSNLE